MARSKKYPPVETLIETQSKNAQFEAERDELSRILTRITENLIFLRGRVEEARQFRSDYTILHDRLVRAYKAIEDFYLRCF